MESKTFKVRFYLDGEIIAENDVISGQKPKIPDNAPKIEGYRLMWLGSDKPTESDTDCFGIPVLGDPEQLLWALGRPLLGYSPEAPDAKGDVITSSNSVLYMLTELRRNYNDIFRNRVVEHLRNMVDPEKNAAPYFDLSCNWPYCPLTAAIALAHETPEVWNELTPLEREKFDFIMECFAYVAALGTNDPNNYRTGPGLCGNFGKTWNPNYRLANIPPIIFAARYFGGADAIDRMLLSFDYDKTLKRFEKYNFNRAYKRWTTPAPTVDGVTKRGQKDFMERGGEAFINTTEERLHYVPGVSGGHGVGVRAKYTYRGVTLDDYERIIDNLLRYNFGGGKVVSTYGAYPDGSPKAYIADHTVSPVEGRLGMMTELASGDGGNGKDGADIRSCTGYCTHDFLLVCAMLLSCSELGMYNIDAPENEDVYRLAWVGMTDYLYKCEHGYMSYALGHEKGIKYESENAGYFVMKSWWLQNYGKEK